MSSKNKNSKSRNSKALTKQAIVSLVRKEVLKENELKAVQVTSSTNVTTSTTVYPGFYLTGIAQGTDYNQRVANAVKGVSLKLRVQCNNGTTAPYLLRIIAIKCIGVTPTTLAFATPFLNNSMQSFDDVREVPQAYHILYDKTRVVGCQTTTSNGLALWDVSIPVRNTKFTFVSTSNAVASAGANGIIVFFGVDATPAGQVVAFQYKFEYTDM